MSEIRLLIADGDRDTQNNICEFFTARSFVCDCCQDGITALKLTRRRDYDAVVLSVDLPEIDGINVCRQLRHGSDIPVIMTAQQPDDTDRLLGFEAGADDYVVKPVSCAVLLARLKVLLRRSGKNSDGLHQKIAFDGLCIDNASRLVYIDDIPVSLTPKEYDLLHFLAQNPNMAFSRNDLLNEVWGYDFFGSDRTVDTHIRMLRDAIRPYQNYIVTVWGFGYRFAQQ